MDPTTPSALVFVPGLWKRYGTAEALCGVSFEVDIQRGLLAMVLPAAELLGRPWVDGNDPEELA